MMDAEAASQQLHAEHLHPMSSGAGDLRCATHISDGQRGLPPGDSEGSSLLASPPAAGAPPLMSDADGRHSECQGGELPMDPVDLSCAWDPLKSTSCDVSTNRYHET